MMHRVYQAAVPELYLSNIFQLTSEVHNYNLRGSKFDMQ